MHTHTHQTHAYLEHDLPLDVVEQVLEDLLAWLGNLLQGCKDTRQVTRLSTRYRLRLRIHAT